MEKNFKAQYTTVTAISLIVGVVIGIGIFFKAPEVLAKANYNVNYASIAWIIGGIATLAAGLTVAEIGAMFPEASGIVDWGKNITYKVTKSTNASKYISFLFGTVLMLIFGPGVIMVVGFYCIEFIRAGLNVELSIVAHLSILAFLVVSLAGITIFMPRLGLTMQKSATLLKLVPIVMAIAAVAIFRARGMEIETTTTELVIDATSPWWIAITSALLPVLFAYDGWMYTANIANELPNPSKQLPTAILVGLGIIVVTYLFLNLPLLLSVPAAEIMAIGGITGVVRQVGGELVGNLMFLAIGVSAYGGFSGLFVLFTRTPLAMAEEQLLPYSDKIVRKNKNNESVAATMILATMVLFYTVAVYIIGTAFYEGEYAKVVDIMGDLPIGVIWILYLFVFIGVIVLRFVDKETKRPYKTLLYPITPLLAIFAGILALGSTIINAKTYLIIDLIVLAIFVLIYHFFWHKAD